MVSIRALFLLLSFVGVLTAQTNTTKLRVTREAELPRFSYPVTGTAQQLLEAPASEFLKFAMPVQSDIDKVLAGYDIEDHATRRKMLLARLRVDLIAGNRDQQSLESIEQIRALEDKPAEKLTSALEEEVYVRARLASPVVVPGTCPGIYEALYRAALKPLPWTTASAGIQELSLRNEVASDKFLVGMTDSQVGPTLLKQHTLSLGEAEFMIEMRATMLVMAPCTGPALAALKAYKTVNDVAKPDIWAAREVKLPPTDNLIPVNVAIWDSGIDLALFPGRLYTNPSPLSNEDLHGIAFDVQALPTHGELISQTEEERQHFPELVKQMEGGADLEIGLDTPAATALKAQLRSMSPTQIRVFFDRMSIAGGYGHGTHVAGIAAHGNPAIRLAYARVTYDNDNPHHSPTDQNQRNLDAMYATAVAWFKSHGIRVVNMSWWNRPSNYEKDLADNGIGKDDAERKELARRYFSGERDALFKAIQGAPEILFVTIAGNNDANNAFEECIPSSFVLPNLIVTGAVDQAGDETSFTSYGANVLVHANGLGVASVVPGGATVKESGTSMAAPQVTNLAAKLLAVSPSLTPTQVIALIRDGSTPSDDGRRHLINPSRSLQLLQAHSVERVSR